MPKPKLQGVSVTTGTIMRVVLTLLGLTFLWFIRDILAVFFVALLLAALIDPFAHWFERHRIPRGVGVLIVYVLLAAIVTGVTLLIVPPLVSQVGSLADNFEGTLGSASELLGDVRAFSDQYGFADNLADSFATLQSGVTNVFTNLFSTLAGFIEGIASVSLVLVLAFYMVVEEGSAKKLFRSITPKKYRPYISGLVGRMQEKLGAWLRGQIILMVVIGLLTYIGLLILGVDYALVLAIFAGIAEIVPYAGPIIAAVPAILIAFTISPLKALIVAALYFGIQQLENGVLTPKIMQKSVGLNPVVSLFALLVGFRLGGFVGALLAIPVATMLAVFIRDVIGNE